MGNTQSETKNILWWTEQELTRTECQPYPIYKENWTNTLKCSKETNYRNILYVIFVNDNHYIDWSHLNKHTYIRVVSEAQFKFGATPKKAKNRSKIWVFLLKGLILSQKSVFTLKSFLFLYGSCLSLACFMDIFLYFSDFSRLTFLQDGFLYKRKTCN